jgi:hypothetical protein
MEEEPRGVPIGGRYAAQQRGRAGSRLVGLRSEDLSRVMEQFGVSEEQVRRDHAISVILTRAHRRACRAALARSCHLAARLLTEQWRRPQPSPGSPAASRSVSGQTRLIVTAQEALDGVRAAWSHILGDDW